MSELAKPSIVLVHGLWADASSFNRIIPTLQEEGHEVFAPQFGLDTLAGDVDAVKRALGRVSSPIILVGHSYGGTLVTAAGVDDRVAGLVYIAGLAPDTDETSQSLQDKFPVTDLFKANQVEVSEGRLWMKPGAAAHFATGLSASKRKALWATHAAPAADILTQKVEGTAWKTKPSWYVLVKDDRVAHPALQHFVARRMGAITYETSGGHISMLSNPELVLAVVREAANAIAVASTATDAAG
jgi:pimeloyl-ACP methyl ester carboxylesterase